MVRYSQQVDAGFARGRRMVGDLCRELDDALRAAGLTYASVGRAVGLSGDQVARICHGEARTVGIVQLAALFATAGLELSARAYPAGDALRDAPQTALLRRFRARSNGALPIRFEVPVVDRSVMSGIGRGDMRAWDAVLDVRGKAVAVEAETRVRDVQALLRRLELKRRDGSVDRLLLVINNTVHNRATLTAGREALRAQFPGSARSALGLLRAGAVPEADTILIL